MVARALHPAKACNEFDAPFPTVLWLLQPVAPVPRLGSNAALVWQRFLAFTHEQIVQRQRSVLRPSLIIGV